LDQFPCSSTLSADYQPAQQYFVLTSYLDVTLDDCSRLSFSSRFEQSHRSSTSSCMALFEFFLLDLLSLNLQKAIFMVLAGPQTSISDLFPFVQYVAAMIALFAQCADRLGNKLEASHRKGEPVEMESLYSRMALDVIGKAVFNYEFDSLSHDTGIVEVRAFGQVEVPKDRLEMRFRSGGCVIQKVGACSNMPGCADSGVFD
jgi:hypothetical protein